MEHKNRTLYIILGVIGLLLIGWVFWGGGSSDGGVGQNPLTERELKARPALSQDELLGKAQPPQGTKTDIAAYKTHILSRANSSKPLTAEEKQSISIVMLSEAHLYGFTESERTAIFGALSR
ncbi:MAG: hypothetical protein A2849_00325 [Candidatus Taylorbacteria bacterium RIFCSPHIGHO2_01_FULL_51_15]|uniref:Uncharacterized protein n=1 Tax=Candidatus Taylorbacteria bacterium RIFCSPHIGHO2_01_FULL_51_15 TaxID=1802304 RepID=A0A1G2MBF0_9BACT|nr:MAG: hypothetical protein A2849_00325 [Candidatus Taylorbacteria bacterium RIFCSPHIGHO2_01_FULL_51_15]